MCWHGRGETSLIQKLLSCIGNGKGEGGNHKQGAVRSDRCPGEFFKVQDNLELGIYILGCVLGRFV